MKNLFLALISWVWKIHFGFIQQLSIFRYIGNTRAELPYFIFLSFASLISCLFMFLIGVITGFSILGFIISIATFIFIFF